MIKSTQRKAKKYSLKKILCKSLKINKCKQCNEIIENKHSAPPSMRHQLLALFEMSNWEAEEGEG